MSKDEKEVTENGHDKSKGYETASLTKFNPDEESHEEKLPYPKSVFFIVSNEFCERFSYYGMRSTRLMKPSTMMGETSRNRSHPRSASGINSPSVECGCGSLRLLYKYLLKPNLQTVLSLYLVDILLFSESDATVIFHAFTMLVYFFPIFGAILSDSLLGKFKTILYVSCIYACGNIVLSLAATPPLNFPAREISILGLLLIAIGTGGIKPCVSAFGGDQFIIPQQEKQLMMFFSLFYFSINAGSLISTAITPILREDVKCFDEDSCYSLAFAVPGVLMIISIIVFGLGKSMYRIKKPQGNMLVKVSKCIGNAISTKAKSKGVKKDHWLDYAEEKYGAKLVNDIKASLKVLLLYIPLPIFWALFDQQGSGWTFMARRMDGDIGFYTILPDQMQVVNPLLILLFIPLFQYVIYPLLTKCKILTTPLQRLVAGGCLAAVSFIVSALICLALESTYPVLPTRGNGHIRIYNGLPCDITIKAPGLSQNDINIPKLQNYTHTGINVNNVVELEYSLSSSCSNFNDGIFDVYEKKSTGFFFKGLNEKPTHFDDNIEKNSNGNPNIKVLINPNGKFDNIIRTRFMTDDGEEEISILSNDTSLNELDPGEYTIRIGDNFSIKKELFLGAVYSLTVTANSADSFDVNLLEVTQANSIHILLLLPQYVIITMGEIMYSITGLEFAYSQAPTSMKSVMQACWLLTTAFGNLIVVIIESLEIFEEQSNTFFLYAGIMLIDMGIFSLMAMRYTYVKTQTDEDEVHLPTKQQNGIDNVAFKNNDET